jgi:predicted enzyme related to lactoylglutathione lyase
MEIPAQSQEPAMPKNAIQHVEWTTRDPKRLKAFYGDVFDWKFFEAMPGYTMIEGLGGIFDAPDPQMPIGITPYVNVSDLDATEAKIARLGGRIHKARQAVPGRGWFTLFSDPDGNIIGIWQPLKAAPATARKTTRSPVKKSARTPSGKPASKAGATARRTAAKKALTPAARRRRS